jgi:hypothetical protein
MATGGPKSSPALGASGGPHVKVWSGINNSILRDFFAYAPSSTGGVRVEAVAIDGDRKADIPTGAGAGGGPRVKVLTGASLADVRWFFALDPGFVVGVYVGAGRSPLTGRSPRRRIR